MKQFRKFAAGLCALAILAAGCSKKNDEVQVDKEYPVIDLTTENNFPKQCSVLKRGETFTFRARLTDNAQLGSVSVDVHHNFDHHSHSTELQECDMAAVKTPADPFLLIKSYTIPGGLKEFVVEQQISIPANADTGDYHFLIRLTDKEGWQTIKGLSIKIQ